MAIKRVLRYLKWTIELGIQYKKGEHFELVAYLNNDYERDVYDMKGTLEYVFMLGYTAISWSTRKKSCPQLN